MKCPVTKKACANKMCALKGCMKKKKASYNAGKKKPKLKKKR